MGKVTHFSDYDIKTCTTWKNKINPTQTQGYLKSVGCFVLFSGFLKFKLMNSILKIDLAIFIIYTLKRAYFVSQNYI